MIKSIFIGSFFDLPGVVDERGLEREKANGFVVPFPDPARLILAKLVFATSLLESFRFDNEDDYEYDIYFHVFSPIL